MSRLSKSRSVSSRSARPFDRTIRVTLNDRAPFLAFLVSLALVCGYHPDVEVTVRAFRSWSKEARGTDLAREIRAASFRRVKHLHRPCDIGRAWVNIIGCVQFPSVPH